MTVKFSHNGSTKNLAIFDIWKKIHELVTIEGLGNNLISQTCFFGVLLFLIIIMGEIFSHKGCLKSILWNSGYQPSVGDVIIHFKAAMRRAGHNPTDVEVLDIINKIDDDSGSLDFQVVRLCVCECVFVGGEVVCKCT